MNLFRYLIRQLKTSINLTGYIDTEGAERAIRNNIFFRGPNAWILAIATIIASVGLNVNSTAVVIGAMLVSPLMGPIFGLGLGLGVNDMQLMKSSGKNLLVMVENRCAHSWASSMLPPDPTQRTLLACSKRETAFSIFWGCTRSRVC